MKKKSGDKKNKVTERVQAIRTLMNEKKYTKHPGGRPTIYTEELVQEILNRLTQGECLEAICRDEHMPSVVTVFDWRKKNKEFFKGYSRARKLQAEVFGDKIRLMADGVATFAENCNETIGATSKAKAMVEATKLRAGMYQWLAAKYNDKLFGDKSKQTVKTDLTIKEKENIPIEDRVNRIGDLIAKKKKISGEDK